MTFAQALNADLDLSFVSLVDEYQERLYRFGLRLTDNSHDAEEIAQDAFVRAYKWLRGHRPLPETFPLNAWLYRIALNVFRNRVRRGRPMMMDVLAAMQLADESETPSASSERRETREELQALLADLPVRYREAVVLRYVEELSYTEIGSVLSKPEGTVKSDVHRGLALLRATFREQRAEAFA